MSVALYKLPKAERKLRCLEINKLKKECTELKKSISRHENLIEWETFQLNSKQKRLNHLKAFYQVSYSE